MKKNESLVDKAFEEIKKRILSGEYQPGMKLSTQSLSDALNMSRTPVVSAINRLIAEDLAEAIPRRGVMVARLSPRKIMEATEVRLMIEIYCAQVAIKNIDFYPEIIRELDQISQQLQAEEPLDTAEASRLEQRFHSLFVRLAGNERLLSTYERNLSIDTVFYLYALAGVGFSSIQASYRETKDIFEALISRDQKRLEDCIKKHLQTIFDIINWYTFKKQEHTD